MTAYVTLACYGGKIYMTSFGKVVQLGADLCCYLKKEAVQNLLNLVKVVVYPVLLLF